MEETITIKPDGKVFLILPDNSFKSTRYIGSISNDVFQTERETDKHLLRVNQSLGFNYKLMKKSPEKLFSLICVVLDFNKIWTSKEVILRHGEFMKFSKKFFELQIFLPLRYFKETEEEARAELRVLQLSDALEFKDTASRKLKAVAGAVKSLQGGLF